MDRFYPIRMTLAAQIPYLATAVFGAICYTFTAGVCLSLPGIFAAFVTYKRFKQMGGFQGYVAPES
ncbi:MAG: hypothetical protein ACK5NG_10835 [Chthoniobacterales bacterium]